MSENLEKLNGKKPASNLDLNYLLILVIYMKM